MNADEFIDALKIVVHDSAIIGIESSLRKPSGRQPRASLVAASQWFGGLKQEEQEIVRTIVTRSVHAAIFGMLGVLDGVRAIESREEKGQLVLSFEDASGVVRLNNTHGEMLHDIYQAKVYDEVFGKKANQRIEPITRSAVRSRFQSNASDALLVMAHPGRSV
ncbi:MAG: hypothetical protein PHD76_08595 [Methylacidiphilales bacterium]|nr:hypothetical protein [Candidatus Methylacidiphilales bacterium]